MTYPSPRDVRVLRDGWKFSHGHAPERAEVEYDDSAWDTVRVPHDWAISGPFDRENDIHFTAIVEDGETKERAHTGRTGGLPHVGRAWYRLHFDLPEDIGSRRVRIEFDGVMSHSRVYCNGKSAGAWPFGYASFMFELTDLVQAGENVLAVSVDNQPLASRWYPGAGIFRYVRLVTLAPVHVGQWGTYITTPEIEKDEATVRILTDIDYGLDRPALVELQTEIIDADGEVVGRAVDKQTIDGDTAIEQSVRIANPQLWSVETPDLYTTRSTIRVDGDLMDLYQGRFGIRRIEFDARQGFLLNRRRVPLNGVCMHHDLGPLGSALNRAALRRQLKTLKEMGCNAIRTSHNPPAPELLDFADEMGILILDEAFDEWRGQKVENGYHTLFDEWAEKDLRALIRRDRNHPSVIMWSLGNEIVEQRDAEHGREVCRFLHDIAHDEDPTRPTTCGFNCSDEAIANGLADVVDIPGWNYKPHFYARYAADHPDWPMYGSETASCVSSRGEYYFPVEGERHLTRETLQVNSYDLSSPEWASSPDAEFRGIDENPGIMGEFVWTGFDYLGEPTPYSTEWPSRSSYFGIVDLCGLPKDRFYLYQSRWADAGTLHLLPHWTWPGREGDVTPVHCYSSWPLVELFVNGVSQGKRSKHPKNLMDRYRLTWSGVRYEPGEIKAVAFDAGGNPVSEVVVKTAAEPEAIHLTVDPDTIVADGDDMGFVTVEIVDVQGVLCPRADNLVRFRAEGPVEIVAVGNGDPTSLEPFQAHQRKAFNGKCVVYLRSIAGKPGTARLHAESDGLREAAVEIATV